MNSKIDVLNSLEPLVRKLMADHEARRTLWYPSELLASAPGTEGERDDVAHLSRLRERARGISAPVRVALALNLLTEEGLPHFHRLIAVHLGSGNVWSEWNNLWTAEEDRHGAVLHDYARDAALFDAPVIERMQFEYVRAGFNPEWGDDPYRILIYTSLQERATQVSHANTGRLAGEHEPLIGSVLQNIVKEEARHYTFYRAAFKGVLDADPNRALVSAAAIMPAIDMPGLTMPHFEEMADAIRRAGIYGPRDYQKIVEELIRFWGIEQFSGLNDEGRQAQEKIMAIPARLARIGEIMERRTRPRQFSFAVTGGNAFTMNESAGDGAEASRSEPTSPGARPPESGL